MPSYQDILVTQQERILTIKLNRPEARNALRNQLLAEIADVLDLASDNDDIACVIITGSERFFAAGADVVEMSKLDMQGVLNDQRPSYYARISKFPKPLIAAVNGFALGGGCELVMHADIVIAGTNACFGQPEINLGIIPGAGGTQRLIRCVGKALASKMVLSGEFIDAQTALSAGLVSEITQPELCLERAMDLARTIASKSPLALKLAKDVLQKSFETSLSGGLDYERKAFVMLAGSDDRNEGLAAFLEKRKPKFTGR